MMFTKEKNGRSWLEHTGIMALQGCASALRYVEPLDWAPIVKVRQME